MLLPNLHDGASFSSFLPFFFPPFSYPLALTAFVGGGGASGQLTSRTKVSFILKVQIISGCELKAIICYIRYLTRIKALRMIISSVWIAFDYIQKFLL